MDENQLAVIDAGFTFLDGISWDAVAEHHDFEDLDDCTTRETDNQLCVAKHNCDCVPKYGNFKYMEGLALGTDYEIRETPDRGKGVFTLREIPANTYLMVYSGEIINGISVRERRNSKGNNYIITYYKHKPEAVKRKKGAKKVQETSIDVAKKSQYLDGTNGSDLKYVNHACCQSGNCKLELWKIGHIIAYCLFSKNKPIPTNTELTYSYFNGKFDSNKNRDLLPSCNCAKCIDDRTCKDPNCKDLPPFKYKSRLTRHQKDKHSNQVYACRVRKKCTKIYDTEGSRDRHEKNCKVR